MRQTLIQRIDEFCRRRGIAPATVTGRAVGNSRLYARLLAGGDCTTEVAARVLAWLERQQPTGDVQPGEAAQRPEPGE
jgi:hypothetical protein